MSIAKKGKPRKGNPDSWKCSKETRKKISIANTGKLSPKKGTTLSDEIKMRMSIAKTGDGNPMYGKYHSAKTREKMRKANLGKRHSEETKKKWRLARSKRSKLKKEQITKEYKQAGIRQGKTYAEYLKEDKARKLLNNKKDCMTKEIKGTDKYKFCNHHHELDDKHQMVDFGDGKFVANNEAILLLKELNAIGLRTRTHHIDK
ncbi:MAG: hypothetical protein KAU20_06040, partial [Nanoarchaeota archaeon]|nr:hypothetical protein [Nanoarchaeota archaeon]